MRIDTDKFTYHIVCLKICVKTAKITVQSLPKNKWPVIKPQQKVYGKLFQKYVGGIFQVFWKYNEHMLVLC